MSSQPPTVELLPPPFPLIGLGMSAGGLEAVTQLFEALPAPGRLAMVLIQHLAPNHPSALPALLAARTPLKIVEATDGIKVAPGHLYTIPPNALIELADGSLRLLPRPTDQVLPIDFFFNSLATVQGDRAVAVVLSGTGSDGRAGIRAVKAAGGTVIAQQPDTARYDGMPRAAIETGLVDLVLPPAEIASKLVELASHSYTAAPPVQAAALPITDRQFETVLDLLREASGVDFAHYKQATIKRRIMRRMALARVNEVADYVSYLQGRHEEAEKLYQDILIHVTRFFRDPESFDALASLVLPKILQGRRTDNPVRVWVAGCATGEEAYSLAITLTEAIGEAGSDVPLQIFGTDISETAVEYARQGTYPSRIAEDVPAKTLRRYFAKVDAGYRISKAIRDSCVFARQDLTRDPPFSKLDLILCRNVLIYMDATLQRRVIPVFHYALKTTGYLVLGQAETIGSQTELFAIVDKKYRIYRKKAAESITLSAPFTVQPLTKVSVARPSVAFTGDARLVQNEANRIVLDRYGPDGVLVNDDLEIVQFRGHTGRYLEPAPGDATLSLFKLAREGLLHPLRTAVQAVRKSRRPVRKEGIKVRSNGDWTDLDLEVIPLGGPPLHFLILFDHPRQVRQKAARGVPARVKGREAGRTVRLEEELAATREYLQSIIQEVEAANEELQSANEEILSSNEELQSTNEELDTAKEELQSTNEELNTLNEELHARNDELTRVNSDLVNLLGSVDIAIVIVSNDLRIRRFTPMAEKMLNLIGADIGRPITQVNPNIECPDLGDLLFDVIDRVTAVEREVRDRSGRWFSLRIRPYKGLENRIDGAVVALVDIDSSKRHQSELSSARAQLEAIAETVRQPVVLLDQGLRVRGVNAAFSQAYGTPAAESPGRAISDLGGGLWQAPGVREVLERSLADGTPIEGHLVRLDHSGEERMVRLDGRVFDLAGERGGQTVLLLAIEEPAMRRV